MEHEIKIAVFTLINEINKKGKSLLQQLEVREYYKRQSGQELHAAEKNHSHLFIVIGLATAFCMYLYESSACALCSCTGRY